MKELVISLMILVGGNKIETKNITIYESCYTWYQKNVEMTEKKTTLFSRRSYHNYQGLRVVGYICSDNKPEWAHEKNYALCLGWIGQELFI